MYNMIHYNFII